MAIGTPFVTNLLMGRLLYKIVFKLWLLTWTDMFHDKGE